MPTAGPRTVRPRRTGGHAEQRRTAQGRAERRPQRLPLYRPPPIAHRPSAIPYRRRSITARRHSAYQTAPCSTRGEWALARSEVEGREGNREAGGVGGEGQRRCCHGPCDAMMRCR